jgi:exonuclease III
MNSNQQISILQYNVNRSQATTQSLLNHPNSKKLAILAVQEQHCSSRTGTSLPHQSWTIIETPSQDPGKKPRAAIFVNNRILPATLFQALHYPSSDIAMIQVKTDEDSLPMLLINVYNTKGTTLINDLATFLRSHLRHHQYDAIAMVGDFNLHHPLWNPPDYEAHDHEAEDLIDLMATNGLNLILPAGIITFPRNSTTIDLVWGNAQMEEKVLRCKVAHNHDHGSDHFPILTTLDMKPERIEQVPMYNFERTDWSLLKTKIVEFLPPITDEPASPAMVDRLAEDITAALAKAIECTTPRRRISPFSKRWWTEELTKARRETNKARNKFKRTGNEEHQKVWKKREREYRAKIKKAKRRTWRKFVKEANEKTIWKLKKYMDSTPTSSYIPTINETAASNDEKAEIFKSTFFPPPPPADLSDIEAADYPEPVPSPPANHPISSRNGDGKALSEESPRTRRDPQPHPQKVLQ